MTTYQRGEIACSNCGWRIEVHYLSSTNAFGSPDLDLRPPEMERSAMLGQLQQCRQCGRVALNLEEPMGDEASVLESPAYEAARSDAAIPELARRFVCLSLLARHRGDQGEVFQALLCAAWVADDEKLDDLARDLRKDAAESLMDKLDLQPGGKLQLLDVIRRSRDWPLAERLCDELMAEPLEHPMNAVAAFQGELIRNQNDGCYRVIDAVEDAAG